jgi:hypothetical protein
MSDLFAADNVGGVPPGHLTAAGHVIVRPPVASCVRMSVKLYARPDAGTLLKVRVVMLVDSVTVKMLPVKQLIVVVVALVWAVLSSV